MAKISELLLLGRTIKEQLLVDGFALPLPIEILDCVRGFFLNGDTFETLRFARCAPVFFTHRVTSIAFKHSRDKQGKLYLYFTQSGPLAINIVSHSFEWLELLHPWSCRLPYELAGDAGQN